MKPGTGKYVQIVPSDPDAKVLLSGDMSVNPGIWVRQSIASGSKSFGKYANVALEKWTFRQMMDEWCRITGHKGEYIPCKPEQWTELWGPAGTEVSFSPSETCCWEWPYSDADGDV